jgi:Rho-binding antiterminator
MTEAGKTTDYRPISCSVYSEYEVAILHREKLRLSWCSDNVIYNQVVLPLDLRTVHGEEFLICRIESGETCHIRLDHIRKMERA